MSKPERIRLDASTMAILDRRRRIKDKIANVTIGFGGVFVVLAITLIFVYLLAESWPLFKQAEFDKKQQYQAQQHALWVDMDEYNQTGIRVLATGEVQYFEVKTGKTSTFEQLALPQGVSVSAIERSSVLQGLVGAGLSNGQLLVFKANYAVDVAEDGNRKTVTPSLSFPYGATPLIVSDVPQPLTTFALQGSEDTLQVMAVVNNQLVWQRFAQQKTSTDEGLGLSSAMDETEAQDKTFERVTHQKVAADSQAIHHIVLGQEARWAYVFTEADIAVFKINEGEPILYQTLKAALDEAKITTVMPLQGDVSVLVGDNKGVISQWFLVRDTHRVEDKFSLQKIRHFQLGSAPITAIAPEAKRKGFVAGDSQGKIGYFYTTSERTLGIYQADNTAINALSVSARSEGVFVQSVHGASFWSLHSEHPDISIKSAWHKVWYESYPEPTYTWQSTSGNADFEGKMSLMPLTFGTLKAAFYAMLLAAPLAIFGAMYTAVFMSPALRTKVKPAIELMQALPTVILGFLAGLWLAPTLEENLPGIISLLIITPLIILVCGFIWVQIPLEKRNRIPDGWAPVILIAPILLGAWISFASSQNIELQFFGGDIRHWLTYEAGITFDQRNSLIVGLAMGFAVIAPIFSIAEDALFAVPRHLTNGSLALGATQWQTLTRVILPTASPGIFSALMIGFGRAVGETMIVLMATGNTAVMEWNIFEGMRTLSANVAVEMAEAEVGSTHFRILFLSALVLFVLTFILNTVAEVVRSRLRKKYGSL
jgi:phosphate transport system permease protein